MQVRSNPTEAHADPLTLLSSFDLAMDPAVDYANVSTCTTCRFVEDKSNYWAAVMYFKHPNGSFIRVPQMSNHNTGPGLQSGGMTIYYFQPNPPTQNRTIVPFAKSHVAQPEGTPGTDGLQFFGTDCPASHPVRLPLLFMEIVWDTRPFNTPELWPKDGSQPFVFSMGDPTGFGQHAAYVFAWEGDSLKRAMDVCTGATGIPDDCPALTQQSTQDMNACRQAVKVEEEVEGIYLDKLPGCNPLQAGPAPATMVQEANCNAVTTMITDAPLPTADPEIIIPTLERLLGWTWDAYLGA
ncbi:hypothetical protein H1R20_g15140, partial [Candolleomyces eurysporus]